VNASAPLSKWLIVIAVLFLSGLSIAQPGDDWHLQRTELFAKSTFAHGYMHGYEEGFHSGDLDLQMGRSYRDVKCQEKFRKPVGFKGDFGSKGLFDDGYRKGFQVGYTDAFAGRNFRAVQLIQQSSASSPKSGPIGENRDFDTAFRQGYETGQKKGLEEGRSAATQNTAPLQCQEQLQAKGGSGEPKADYCEAFRGGYQLGYSDGFANQRDSRVVAQK
jgi:hypothetical protein